MQELTRTKEMLTAGYGPTVGAQVLIVYLHYCLGFLCGPLYLGSAEHCWIGIRKSSD